MSISWSSDIFSDNQSGEMKFKSGSSSGDTNTINHGNDGLDVVKASASTPYDLQFSVPAPFQQCDDEYSDSDEHHSSSDSEGIFVLSLIFIHKKYNNKFMMTNVYQLPQCNIKRNCELKIVYQQNIQNFQQYRLPDSAHHQTPRWTQYLIYENNDL